MTAKSMWKWLRQHEKMILAAIVVLILPLFGFGTLLTSQVVRSKEKNISAVVDGYKVTVEEVSALKRRWVPLVDSFQRFVQAQYGGQREVKVENADLWKHIAILREAQAGGIRVTDEEVRELIEDYTKAYEKAPHLRQAFSFLTQKEILIYAQMMNYHAFFSIAQREKFTKERYDSFLKRFQISDSAFRTTIREALTILKFKYFRWRTVVVPTSKAYDAYKDKNVSVQCHYVRFDRVAPANPEPEIPEKELLEHYEKNRQGFEEPMRKTVEYLHARVEDVQRRVALTREEKLAFYEREKDNLFKAPPAEKKEEGAPGEKKAEPPGEKKEEPPGEKKEEAPAEKKAEPAGESKGEKPAAVHKPFDDPEVQAVIVKRLSEQSARLFLESLMGRISLTMKRLEEEIRQKAREFPDVNQELRTQISFDRISRNIADDPDWTGAFPGYRPRVVRDEQFRTKDEFVSAHGDIGPRVAEKFWNLPPLIPSDVVAVPDGYVVFWVLEYKPPTVPPFADVRKKVEEDLRLSRALEAARQRAGEARRRMDASSFGTVAKEEGLQVLSTGFFRAGAATVPGFGSFPALGEAPAFVLTAFALPGDRISAPVEERKLQAVFLIQVEQRKKPEPPEMSDRERDTLVDQEKNRLWEALGRPWGDDFMKHHKVEDKTRDRDVE